MPMTANDRVKKQRSERKKHGWVEVRVWVPKQEQANYIQQYAQRCRDNFDPKHHSYTFEALVKEIECHPVNL